MTSTKSTPWLRAWTKVKVAKHLFRHRYDYRAEWQRFTDTLGKPGAGADSLQARVVKSIADLTDSPGGLLLGRYKLTGVMIARDSTTVLLRPATGGKVIRLMQGQELDGWRVVSITADQIVLSANGKEQKIALGGAPKAAEGRGGRP